MRNGTIPRLFSPRAIFGLVLASLGIFSGGLAGCRDLGKVEVQRLYHPNGQLADERTVLLQGHGQSLLHGLHMRWRPDGSRMGLDIYQRGLRQGYSLRWTAEGELQNREYCDAGSCSTLSLAQAYPADQAQAKSLAQLSRNSETP